jgi:preprotein translocase subunit SecA
MVTRAIERAQKQVEAQNFSMRKHLLEYDDVMNKQRTAFYDLRREILSGKGQREYLLEIAEDLLGATLDANGLTEKAASGLDADGLVTAMLDQFGIDLTDRVAEMKERPRDEVRKTLLDLLQSKYARKEGELDAMMPGLMRQWEQNLMLGVADNAWRDHLYALDHLKEGIGLRGYAQKDPLVEYKKESFDLFEAMWQTIEAEMVRRVFLFRPVLQQAAPPPPPPRPIQRRELTLTAGGSPQSGGAVSSSTSRSVAKVGRNDPCPCGNGKKYKKCHGA